MPNAEHFLKAIVQYMYANIMGVNLIKKFN